MDKWQKTIINDNAPELIDLMECSPALLANLLKFGVISSAELSELETLKQYKSKHAAAYRLLEISKSRKNGYNHLGKSLYLCGETGAFQILLEGHQENTSNNPLTFFGIHYDIERSSHHVMFEGYRVALTELLEVPDQNLESSTLDEWCNQLAIRKLLGKEDLVVAVQKISKTSDDYINRTVAVANILDVSFFKERSNDVFLIVGIDELQLETLAYNSNSMSFWDKLRAGFPVLSTRSSTQLNGLSARFILLEEVAHHDIILTKTNRVVHYIKYNSGNYYYMKCDSKGSIREIQDYLKPQPEYLDEMKIVSSPLTNRVHWHFVVCDSPGMGKTKLLVSVANKIKGLCIHRNVIYMEFSELVTAFVRLSKPLGLATLHEIFLDKITNNELGRIIQQHMFDNKHPIDLFLDGFDEVFMEYESLALAILQVLKVNENITLYVASRPHKTRHLEKCLRVVAHTIVPLTENEQIALLSRAWMEYTSTLLSEKANNLAREWLFKIKIDTACNCEKDAAGNPLQCKMLADLYSSNINMDKVDAYKNLTIYDMYKRYTEKQFRSIPNSHDEKFMRDEHIRMALADFFPEIFTHKIKIERLEDYCKLGIVESNAEGSLKFIHTTYAQYFVAEYIINTFKGENLEISSSKPPENILLQIFKSYQHTVATIEEEGESYEFETRAFYHTGIAMFFNWAIATVKSNEFSMAALQNIKQKTFNLGEQFVHLLQSCIYTGLNHAYKFILMRLVFQTDSFDFDSPLHCHELFTSDLEQLRVEILQSNIFQHCGSLQIWKNILLAAANSSHIELMHVTYIMCTIITGKQMHEMEYEPSFTPLHVAVMRGNKDVALFLMNIYGESIKSMQQLLHCCVHQSMKHSHEILQSKAVIIEQIFHRFGDVNIANYVHHKTMVPPILTSDIHFDLVMSLIKNKADIRAAVDNMTVSHKIACYFTPAQFHSFVKKAEEIACLDIFQSKNSHGETPIHIALRHIDVQSETIDCLTRSFNVTFMNTNLYGFSEFSQAVVSQKPVNLLQKIINTNTDCVDCESCDHTVLCLSLDYNNLAAFEYFVTFQSLVNKRCCSKFSNIWYHAFKFPENDRPKIFKLLIDNAAIINSPFFVDLIKQLELIQNSKSSFQNSITYKESMQVLCGFHTPKAYALLSKAEPEIVDLLTQSGAITSNALSIILNCFTFVLYLIIIISLAATFGAYLAFLREFSSYFNPQISKVLAVITCISIYLLSLLFGVLIYYLRHGTYEFDIIDTYVVVPIIIFAILIKFFAPKLFGPLYSMHLLEELYN